MGDDALKAGVARRDISPQTPMQLCGYPNVERISEGIHDPLWASALYLEKGDAAVLLVALDILFLDTPTARRCRRTVADALDMAETGVLISCTHTHSGPVSLDRHLSFGKGDPSQAPPPPGFVDFIQEQILAAAREAKAAAVPAEAAWTRARIEGVGTNRHHPAWTTDPECGILVARRMTDQAILGILTVYGMHPTVLHEDSKLVSSDFPHYARESLRECFGDQLVVCYHNAPCGNQSPRHVVQGQTFAEAERLGRILGQSVAAAVQRLTDADYSAQMTLASRIRSVDLPRRVLPSPTESEAILAQYQQQYRKLQKESAPRADVRTAECAVFGANKLVNLAQAKANGTLDALLETCLPADVQVVRIGDRWIVGLPGELFTEYALQIKAAAPGAYPVAYANGMLHGYIVTREALEQGGYEAAGSVLAPEAGTQLVETAVTAIGEAGQA